MNEANMIKSVTMVSDTDSTIISVDAWYRFIVNVINEHELKIANDTKDPTLYANKESWEEDTQLQPKRLDYNFHTDEITERERFNDPTIIPASDNVRYSIISIMSYVLDHTVNDYMVKYCENTNSVKAPYHEQKECKIWAKTEFLFKRLLIVPHAKKNYASLIEIQEGNMVPEDEQLDIKGIEAIKKSSKPLTTRKALQKILLEDILDTPTIDQLQFIKDIAILEKQIIESIKAGSTEYYKPLTIKAMSSYDDPLRIQGIKASIAWNMIRDKELPAIDLNERNAINVIKVNINKTSAEDIKEDFPEIYSNIMNALNDETFKSYIKVTTKNKDDIQKEVESGNPEYTKLYKMDKGDLKKCTGSKIEAIALPTDVQLPAWIVPFIDYNNIISDNLNGFPYEAIGIQRLGKNSVGYTNIVEL